MYTCSICIHTRTNLCIMQLTDQLSIKKSIQAAKTSTFQDMGCQNSMAHWFYLQALIPSCTRIHDNASSTQSHTPSLTQCSMQMVFHLMGLSMACFPLCSHTCTVHFHLILFWKYICSWKLRSCSTLNYGCEVLIWPAFPLQTFEMTIKQT